MYVVVFHGRDRIGYFNTSGKSATGAIAHDAKAGFFELYPLPGHAMSALSDSGTYFLPFERADEIVIVEDLKSLRVNLD